MIGCRYDFGDREVPDPYQLVHRTASACHARASHRWVVYQRFSEKQLPYYRSHLADLFHVLGGPSALRFGLLVTPPEPVRTT